MIGAALVNLSDIATCVSGDFHTLHLNYTGTDYDVMHKQVLKEYYEQAAEDADTWAEAALMYDDQQIMPSFNGAATRINWQSFDTGMVSRDIAVATIDERITAYLEALVTVFSSINQEQDYVNIGIANTLQTRIEYWSKELKYFNRRRA